MHGGLLLLDPLPERAEDDYNDEYPVIFQQRDWTCSAATLAWMLSSIGKPTTENEALVLMKGLVDSHLGLLDGKGSGVIALLNSMGMLSVPINQGDGVPLPCTFEDVAKLAGAGPIGLGGGAWNHWTAVRRYETNLLHLANPSPGYKLVYQTLDRLQFRKLGPFHGIFIEDW